MTTANTPRFNQGSAELVRAFLDAWGISGTVQSWSSERVRTSYFSDYLGVDEEWRDRWQEAWLLHVRGELERSDDSRAYKTLQFVKGFDPTAREEELGAEDRCPALVVVGSREARETLDAVTIPRALALASSHGFPREQIEVSVRQAVAGRRVEDEPTGMREWVQSPPFVNSQGLSTAATKTLAKLDRALNPLYQARLLISDVYFPAQEPALTAVCAALANEGFFVHRHRFEFDALTPLG